MKVIIVGGGKVGGHLARVLTEKKNSVVVVEMSEDRAQMVAQQTRALVIEGDGTDVRILDEADCAHADYLVAVTGSDEDNLVACQLARTAFGCERVLARVNDPRNERTFEALGVPRVSVTGLFVQLLGQHLEVEDLNRVAALGHGEASLVEIEVPAGRSPAAVAALGLPESTVLAAIRRDGAIIIPTGTDQVKPGDKVMVVTFAHNEAQVRSVIRGEYA
ncbi:MAG TPA: NAD-binding protein [Acidimicrobiia bacterium]|nr:NAD-binding protein [Acidimicrobiia bacterium]